MKALILIWSLLLPYMAFGQATSSDTQYRNDGETLINGSFEQGKKGYTLSVGSGSLVWSTQSTTSLNGKAMQLTLSAQTFSFKSATTQGSKLTGQNGYVEVYLSANNSGAEICPLVDGVSAPTTTPNECQPIIAGVGFKPYGIQKVFGASSLNYEIRGVSGASYTGIIYADDGSVAKKSIVTQSSGVRLIGSVKISNCTTLWSVASATFASFPAQTGCTYTTSGEAIAPTTNIPAIRFPKLRAGLYKIELVGLVNSPAGQDAFFQFYDGVNQSLEQGAQGTTTSLDTSIVLANLNYLTDQTDTTMQVRAKSNSGSANVYGTVTYPVVINVYYFPPQPISTINTSNGWFIDANIGGGAVSSAISSSYVELTNASLDLVLNTSKGSADAQIACASGTDSTGLTCSSNESVGITFVNPKTGKFRACFAYAVNMNNGNFTTQLVETTTTSSAIVQEGSARYNAYSGNSGTLARYPIENCSTFNFNDVKRRTIRLMYESDVANPQLLLDRDVSTGQRDLHIWIEPIVENIQASLQGYNSTDGVIDPEVFSFSYGTTNASTSCTVSPCSYLNQIGSHVTSITRNSTGVYTPNFSKTYSQLKCVINSYGFATGQYTIQNALTCTNCNSGTFVTVNLGSANVDTAGTLYCHGVK